MMRLRCLWLLAWMAVFPDVGHTDPPDPSPTIPLQTVSLLRHNSLAQFQLLLGRPQLDAVQYRKGSQTNLLSPDHSLGDARSVLQESLSTTSFRGLPTLHYTLASDTVKVTVDIAASGTWTIDSQRHVSGDVQHVRLTQTPNQPLLLVCHSSLPELKLRASTWLHLREADRVVFDHHLLPLIQQMIAPYQFEQIAELTYSQAVQDNAVKTIDSRHVDELIRSLSSSQRQERSMAFRELDSMGIELLPLLDQLDLTRLDAEQRASILVLRRNIRPSGEDSPERLATMIRHDASYWKLAGARMTDTERLQIANRFHAAGLPTPVQPNASLVRVAKVVRD